MNKKNDYFELQVWHVLLIGFMIGIFFGYTWHYQSDVWRIKNAQDGEMVYLNGHIPAEIITQP